MTILRKFDSIKGASFISINGYESSKGEIANHTINVNVDVMNAKKKDLETLKNFPALQLNEIVKKIEGATKEIALKAIEELATSAEKNVNVDPNERTNQSKGQTNTYVQLGKGLKLHKDLELNTVNLFVSGFANKKTVIQKGTYKKVNSSAKTLVKKEISNTLRMSKFRNYKLKNADALTVTGSTIQL